MNTRGYRSPLRTMVAATNPARELDQIEEIQSRVEMQKQSHQIRAEEPTANEIVRKRAMTAEQAKKVV